MRGHPRARKSAPRHERPAAVLERHPRFAGGLRLLVLHDDAEREFDYTAGAEEALAQGWTTISVKDDWATVFA